MINLLFIESLWNILKDIFNDNYPLIILIVLLVILVVLVWWASKMYSKISNLPCENHSEQLKGINPLDRKIDLLPCVIHTDELKDHKQAIKDHIDDRAAMKIEMAEIRTSITFLKTSMDNLTHSIQNNKLIIPDPLSKRHSPMRLTEKGEDFAKRLGMYNMIYSNWAWINEFIEKNAASKNPYDIQQFLLEQITVFPERFITEDNLNLLKLEAYKEGLNLMSFTNVLMIIARDMYFKDHNIDLGEIDKHDPNIR